ncbi:MAG: prephenate dehydrogenase [Candidatus Omnitrophota bacterium]|jgi:prephenate dehydrogenase
MARFNKITIIGVGLIGGSIGLAIRKRKLAREVVGVFRRESTLKRALRCKAVDRAAISIGSGVKGADIIIVASPVHSIPKIVKMAAECAKEGAIITDAGSTKSWIVNSVEKSLAKFRKIYFVGSHPMAGSEKTGVEAARSDLLNGAPCIVTKTRNTDKKALEKIKNFWSALGSKVSVMTPEEHDKSVSFVSHLPHLVAFSIAGTVPDKYIKYAAEGFGDTTRVASSDPHLWADILLTNKEEVLASAIAFDKTNKKLIRILKEKDAPSLVKLLSKAKAKRDKFVHGASS